MRIEIPQGPHMIIYLNILDASRDDVSAYRSTAATPLP